MGWVDISEKAIKVTINGADITYDTKTTANNQENTITLQTTPSIGDHVQTIKIKE